VNDLGIKETIALLDALKDVVREFATREEKLETDFQARMAAATRLSDEAALQRTARLAESVDNEKVAYENRKSRRLAIGEKRKDRIARIYSAQRQRLAEETAGEHGRLKDTVQDKTRAAEQHRDNALADTVVALENFRLKGVDAVGLLDQLTLRARRAFGGYGAFKRLLSPDRSWPDPDLTPDENQLFEQSQRLSKKIESDIAQFARFPLPGLFRFLPAWLVILLLVASAGAVPVLQHFAIKAVSWPMAGAGIAVFGILLAIYFYGRRNGIGPAKTIAADIARVRRMLVVASEKSEQRYHADQARIKAEFDAAVRSINQEWRQAVRGTIDSRDERPAELDRRIIDLTKKHETHQERLAQRIDAAHAAEVRRLEQESKVEAEKFQQEHAAKKAKVDAEYQANWSVLEREWTETAFPLFDRVRNLRDRATALFPDWSDAGWQKWQPPADFKNAAPFGRLEVDIEKLAEKRPRRLPLSEANFSVPVALSFPYQGSLLIETNKGGENQAITAINDVIFRLLSTTPPGKASFTIFDPVGLGQNFAALMHLADYEEGAINSRIWTQTTQFEEKLAELTEHMEKVIQMYLRNEYATIAEYNAKAGSIAEKYHFLVIASFPVNFSDVAAKRLRNIAANGARCGVYVLIHWDQRQPAPNDFVPDELRKNTVRLLRGDNSFYLANWHPAGAKLVLETPPSPEFTTKFLHDIGRSSKNSQRVEVPFQQIAPADAKVWSEETTEELRVAIGRSGATKLQYLEIGKGTRQHALVDRWTQPALPRHAAHRRPRRRQERLRRSAACTGATAARAALAVAARRRRTAPAHARAAGTRAWRCRPHPLARSARARGRPRRLSCRRRLRAAVAHCARRRPRRAAERAARGAKSARRMRVDARVGNTGADHRRGDGSARSAARAR